MTSASSITCVIADDHPAVLRFLSRYLSGSGITVTASTSNGEEALQKIVQTHPTVAVLDERMPYRSGMDVLKEIGARGLQTRVILYTGFGDASMLGDAIDAGVMGMLAKDAPVEELLRAIHVVAGGSTYLDATVAAQLIATRRATTLTERERHVLRLLAAGMSNERVGTELFISPQTVRTHLQKAMEKLGAHTRVQAVATALRESLIS